MKARILIDRIAYHRCSHRLDEFEIFLGVHCPKCHDRLYHGCWLSLNGEEMIPCEECANEESARYYDRIGQKL